MCGGATFCKANIPAGPLALVTLISQRLKHQKAIKSQCSIGVFVSQKKVQVMKSYVLGKKKWLNLTAVYLTIPIRVRIQFRSWVMVRVRVGVRVRIGLVTCVVEYSVVVLQTQSYILLAKI